MPPIRRDGDQPYPSFNFRVTVTAAGVTVGASFMEVSGLDVTVEQLTYRTGTDTITARKQPGLITYTDLVLKRGTTGEIDFWAWVASGVNGSATRGEGSIALFEESNQREVMRWNFVRGWAAKYSGPTFNAGTSEIAMESLTICHEGLAVDV